MTIRVTKKAWKALTKKRGHKHDKNKCGVCSRPGFKKWSRAKQDNRGVRPAPSSGEAGR